MSNTRDKKYLVVGSIGHEFVDCVEWDINHIPNFVDYDVIIINVRTLNKEFLENVSSEKIQTFRILLARLLRSYGTLIILSDYYRSGKNENRYPEVYHNYSWCPIDIEIQNEAGDTIEERNNKFPKYFSKFKEWAYYFRKPSNCLTQELTDLLGETGEYTYSYAVKPFFENREKQVLGGVYNWYVKNKFTDHSIGLGPIILLPTLKNVDSREALNLLLEDLIGKPQVSLPPDWIKEVKMPFISDVVIQIGHHATEIKKHEAKIDELQKHRLNLEYYMKLLYADGIELEEVFRKCFIELGASIIPAKYSEEEYCLTYNNDDYPIESKGNTKSISLTDLRQLIDYLLICDEKTGKDHKGILLGNAWKIIPLDQRNTHEKPIFPPNVIKRAEQANIALVSSVDFFFAFCKFLENKKLGKRILECIVTSTGKVNFHKLKE